MDKETLKNIPDLPGVYLMKDSGDNVLYIGKAKSLNKRVLSYFQKHSTLLRRIALMVEKISGIDFIVTSCQEEALILEAALIKKHRPYYNIALKDDKSYPYLALTQNEKFPRLIIVRKKNREPLHKGWVYYGPYTDVKLLRKAHAIMKSVFPLRTCGVMRSKACLNFHINQCLAPCINNISEREYKDLISELKMFLEGKRNELIKQLSCDMQLASKQKDYEKAASIRDRIAALSVVPKTKSKTTPYDEIKELQSLLNLRRTLKRIEIFDISNIAGKQAVGSMVTFTDGLPDKSGYRKFKIRTVNAINDYDMMKEIIRRRYRRVKKERLQRPDLIIIDGGKGHLNAALSVLKEVGFDDLKAIGIAKKFEHIYMQDKKEPVVFSHKSPVLHFIQRMRDEAHRFAIGYHKFLRSKRLKEAFHSLTMLTAVVIMQI